MKNPIYPCLWFDGQAKEASDLYATCFEETKIISENSMVVMLEIYGQKIMCLNGGPQFKINPSISFFVRCTTNQEIDIIWDKLSTGGQALMALNQYPWSERYGWVKDKYGMTWQLMKDELLPGSQKIIPSFLFTNKLFGKAAQAMQFYSSLFPESHILNTQFYPPGDPQQEGKLLFGECALNHFHLIAMDGPGSHDFVFNEGVSFVVLCDDQAEIDYFWNKLTEDGKESRCGWLVDRYGISWQIIPAILGSLMGDPTRSQRVIQAFMQMRKFDIDTLLKA